MDSKDMYGHLLGLKAPWTVGRVDMEVARPSRLTPRNPG